MNQDRSPIRKRSPCPPCFSSKLVQRHSVQTWHARQRLIHHSQRLAIPYKPGLPPPRPATTARATT
jgi:hypothetical protein